MTYQKLESRLEHYQNVSREIKREIAEYLLNEQQPPSILLEQERAAIKMVHSTAQKLSDIDEILNS